MKRLRKLYMGTNTKMYKGIEDTVRFLERLQALTEEFSRETLELFVLPSYTALDRAGQVTDPKLITLGSQNLCWEEQGQYTGEISPLMVKETGASMAMIGHSERRAVFGETDEEENKKVRCALKNDLKALLCIGETAADKEAGISDEVLSMQLKKGLKGVLAKDADRVMVAYEPVWAIGVNGTPASAEYAEARHINLKRVLQEIYPAETAEAIPVLYGGSVNPENAVELIERQGIDGLFIGRSAWDADRFYQIITNVLGKWQ